MMGFGWGVLLRSLALALLFCSCTETIDTAAERRVENEKAFQIYAKNKDGYAKASIPGAFADHYVYMKKLSAGSGSLKPRSTDYVKAYYTGMLLTAFNSGETHYFVSNRNVASPLLIKETRVSEELPGIRIALQNMVVGDKVSVIIPWYLGYGEVNLAPVPTYSALRYEVELVEILGDSL